MLPSTRAAAATGWVAALATPRGLPDVARITRGWGLSVAAGFVCRVAMLVWCFTVGGPALVAVYGVATTVPAAVTTPILTEMASRVRPDRLLRIILAGRTVLLAGSAAAMAVGGQTVLVVVLVGVSAAMAGAYRPIQAAAFPWLVHTPAELSAANVRATVMESSATLAGPALGGVVLTLADPAATMAVCAVIMAIASGSIVRLRISGQATAESRRLRHAARYVAAGAVALAKVIAPGGVLVMAFVQTFVRGLLLVLTVVIALDVLRLGSASVGWLTACTGVGGLAGGLVAGRLLRLSRLARSFVTGVALWGLPLVMLGLWPNAATAFVALFVVGIGNALEDGSMFTLAPRAVGVRLAPVALGVLELVIFVGAGLGSLLAPVLTATPGPLPALVGFGGLLVVLAACYARPSARVDRAAPVPGPDLALLQEFPVFAPLPLVTIEQLLASAGRAEFADGDDVVVQGEPGDVFHLIVSGGATVTVDGDPRPMLHRGDGFGEIALLRDVPRTATVTAEGPLRTITVMREEFLSAVTGNATSRERASLLASDRLSADLDPRAAATLGDGPAEVSSPKRRVI